MLLIDFAKLDKRALAVPMADYGVVDFDGMPLLEVLGRLEVGSSAQPRVNFPTSRRSELIDLSQCTEKLRLKKRIADIVGSVKVPRTSSLYFSTLVSSRPKEYLASYVEVAREICAYGSDLKFTIWLEDTLTAMKDGTDAEAIQRSVYAYSQFFTNELPGAEILISSDVASEGIPEEFSRKLTDVSAQEFLSLLPFHARATTSVKVFDVVHFVWNCYVLDHLPGIYLGGINNKRHFQIFRKIVGKNLTAILLPLGSENLAT